MTFLNPLRKISLHMLGLFLPPTCIRCEALLAPTEPLGVCNACWPKRPVWDLTQTPMPVLPKYVDSFQAPFLYEDMTKAWIARLKFYDQSPLAAPLADFMRPHIPRLADPVFVPVPLHPKRLRKRLYNQSALLAQHLAHQEKADVNVTSLTRPRYSPPQVGKTAKQRRALPLKTFTCASKGITGRNIILIDDLWTTGSTCNACAHALKKAGAARVDVLTLAFTPL